jgi:hypothetical protein
MPKIEFEAFQRSCAIIIPRGDWSEEPLVPKKFYPNKPILDKFFLKVYVNTRG